MGLKIQRPDIWIALQRFFRMTGKGQLQLEPFIIGTVQVGDLSIGQTPPVMRHAIASFGQNGVAVERTVWRFECPAGVICLIRSMVVRPFSNDCNLTGFFGSSIVAPTNVATKAFTDGRIGSSEEPAGVLTSDTQVGGLGTLDYRRWIKTGEANEIVPPLGWVVGTGAQDGFGFLEFSSALDAEGVDVSMEWDEYQIN